MTPLSLADFDYTLPEALIAQHPSPRRDGSRLMLLSPTEPRHHSFAELGDLIERVVGSGTLLVLNDTQVIPARLTGHRLHGDTIGGRIELLLCEPTSDEVWRCLYRAGKPLRTGDRLRLDGESPPACEVVENEGGGKVLVRFPGTDQAALHLALARIGAVPLPPYIRGGATTPEDLSRYQTVYAAVPGAVAAPTAGLHFTPELLTALSRRGMPQTRITLHVGPGTFAPVKVGDLDHHVMHSERYHVPEAAAAAIAAARQEGRKVLAVGTTVVRTLESATPEGESVPHPGWGQTSLFIRPPARLRVADALLTNFHLPRSTLLMLICAMAGRRRVLAAYNEAVRAGYRFFSYGDAMLIPSQMEDL